MAFVVVFLKVNDLTYNVKHGYINGNLNMESTSYANTLNTNIRVLITTYCHIMLLGKNFIDIKYWHSNFLHAMDKKMQISWKININ